MSTTARPVAPPTAPGAKSPFGSAGLSAVIGYASATLVRTIAGGVFVVLAATLALLKWLELQGFIVVNWQAVHAWLGAQTQLLDQNGDGKLDAKDAHLVLRRVQAFMATTAPSAAGFAVGFAYGMS